jgi:pimeloyl-ACP methyl ester carboxylesterase
VAVSFVPVEGGQLAYERQGAGAPVVFLHGLGIDKAVWADVADALAANFDTVCLDLRGHGASSPADVSFAHHEDVVRALDGLGIERVHLVGQSMGGAVALDTALAHPARVRSLALVDAALGGHAWSDEWRDSIRAIRKSEDAKGAWFAHPLFARARAHEIAGAKLQAMIARDAGARWTAREPERALDPPAAGRLAEIHVPTLVLVGEHDLEDFQRAARGLHAGIAGARLVTLAGVGHLAPLEAPLRVARELAAFLAFA